jgi:hypothetical protein
MRWILYYVFLDVDVFGGVGVAQLLIMRFQYEVCEINNAISLPIARALIMLSQFHMEQFQTNRSEYLKPQFQTIGS